MTNDDFRAADHEPADDAAFIAPTTATITATAARAQQARQELVGAARGARAEFPLAGSDRFRAVAEVLDELARLVALVPPTTTRVTGTGDTTIERLAEQLASALVARRNLALRRDPDRG